MSNHQPRVADATNNGSDLLTPRHR